MKILKYILVVSIFTGSVYSDCLFCSVTPVEWNIHMASNETYDEIKKKKKKKGKKVKGKEKGKKGKRGWWKKKAKTIKEG
jgi:hypothetical protein|tara:strand:- start:117 stop:356 length:240 start_codon:yes stop_codon:yes gene_type:complete